MAGSVLFIITSIFILVCSPALADQGGDSAGDLLPQVAQWAITLLGLIVAARLAWQAFGRAVRVADVPTFPKYMTSHRQYLLGSSAFVVFACGFFLLLVHENRQVIMLAPLVPAIPDVILEAVKAQSPPYLIVVAAMGAVFLYLLTKEAEWNALLMMRDVIRIWISVPQLVKQIITQIRFSLRVPAAAIAEVIASAPEVAAADFHKSLPTPDRMWAEICYMKWWLMQRREAGKDAIFFTEDSFGFDQLIQKSQWASYTMGRWKSGTAPDLDLTTFPQTVTELHDNCARLVACYLIYRNGARNNLCAEAKEFGIDVDATAQTNPLRYWIIYAIALIFSVYIGVIVSAVAYDLIDGQGIVLRQDPNRLLAWVLYALCNYGLAIIVVLLLRWILSALGVDANQSHLVTYCWTFLVSFVIGPTGLTVAVHYFGQASLSQLPYPDLYFKMLQWGLGPALVSVYISYYLDRQSCSDLPDIDSSAATLRRRLLNCFAFAVGTVFLLLPNLLSLTAPPDAVWVASKLQFIATGTTFFTAFGLALAAQFALKKEPQPQASLPGVVRTS
ncbi:hypothetical protein [Bradyrhizobium sp. Arg816]|uniref:hypothetical protein n=1 Tax=Bradyrhizobium sp. Arg816 TaxID=2998491 RepID=UPI00249EE18E|nr:hypothetical protein [Bradyrhizobium sp. Arg816]MDI3559620.1 hypothetical protein [Bradyrhizobium sp. Arg816]